MTDHDDDRRPDEAKADEVERELDEMGERHDELGGAIEEAEDQWGRQKKDVRVPGATGELDEDEDGPPPEAQYPSKDQSKEDGDGEDGGELDFGRDVESEDVVGNASPEVDEPDEGESDGGDVDDDGSGDADSEDDADDEDESGAAEDSDDQGEARGG